MICITRRRLPVDAGLDETDGAAALLSFTMALAFVKLALDENLYFLT